MKQGIKQLSEWEIYEIGILLKEGYSIPQVAEKVERNKSTIYRLLKNNGVAYNEAQYQHNRKQKYQLDQRRMIDRRPKSIEHRTTLGHWETDTVVGKRKTRTKKCIYTCVERKSGFLIERVLPNAQAENLAQTVIQEFHSLPKYKRKTMTVDNGRELARHYDIERELQMNIYLAHPYSSWERGTNENTKGLLRQFIPKKTDFKLVSKKQLEKYTTLINLRPRKRLNFLTPYEVFFKKKLKLCTSN